MIIGITGHRSLGGFKLPNPIYNYVTKELRNKLIELKPEKVITGMALGTDQLAADLCIELNIPYIAAIPFIGQEKLWSQSDKNRYKILLEKALETVIVSPGDYAAYKMQIRNKWIVNNVELLIGVFDGSASGTANCIAYAKSVKKNLVIINPKNLI